MGVAQDTAGRIDGRGGWSEGDFSPFVFFSRVLLDEVAFFSEGFLAAAFFSVGFFGFFFPNIGKL